MKPLLSTAQREIVGKMLTGHTLKQKKSGGSAWLSKPLAGGGNYISEIMPSTFAKLIEVGAVEYASTDKSLHLIFKVTEKGKAIIL